MTGPIALAPDGNTAATLLTLLVNLFRSIRQSPHPGPASHRTPALNAPDRPFAFRWPTMIYDAHLMRPPSAR